MSKNKYTVRHLLSSRLKLHAMVTASLISEAAGRN